MRETHFEERGTGVATIDHLGVGVGTEDKVP